MLTRPAPSAPASAAALPPPGVGCPAAICSENSRTERSVTPAAMDRRCITERAERSGSGGGLAALRRRGPRRVGRPQERRDPRRLAPAPEEEPLSKLAPQLAQAFHLLV